MKYVCKNNYWAFGISLHFRECCDGYYTEKELRFEFGKYRIGVVW